MEIINEFLVSLNLRSETGEYSALFIGIIGFIVGVLVYFAFLTLVDLFTKKKGDPSVSKVGASPENSVSSSLPPLGVQTPTSQPNNLPDLSNLQTNSPVSANNIPQVPTPEFVGGSLQVNNTQNIEPNTVLKGVTSDTFVSSQPTNNSLPPLN